MNSYRNAESLAVNVPSPAFSPGPLLSAVPPRGDEATIEASVDRIPLSTP